MLNHPAREPLRLGIPVLLLVLVPLAHLTSLGVTVMERGWVIFGTMIFAPLLANIVYRAVCRA